MKQPAKKILFLGGASSQVPAIKYALQLGCHVITVDYLPNNPGHKISDEYYNISTVNKEKILELSLELNIDAISAYASDPAAETAAYVSEKLGLVGSSYESTKTLSNKILFRSFLENNNFKVPWFLSNENVDSISKNYTDSQAILKPVDSSGSKGVYLINNKEELKLHFGDSKSYSKSGFVILEEFIKKKGNQIHGEGFVINGELSFILLGDQFFSPVNPLAPYSTIVPSICHASIMDELILVVDSIIKKLKFKTGGINIEIIRDHNDNLYVLEIGARNGGNYMPQLMNHVSNVDLSKLNVEALLNQVSTKINFKTPKDYFAQVILHSCKSGVFRGLNIPNTIKDYVLEKNVYYKIGDRVNKYKNSKDVVGVIILRLKQENLNDYFQALEANKWVITI